MKIFLTGSTHFALIYFSWVIINETNTLHLVYNMYQKIDEMSDDDYDDSLHYEAGRLALPFSIFSLGQSSFSTSSNEGPSSLVEEVFAHRRKVDSQSYTWEDIIAVNDSKAKDELFKKYLSQESPERIFRTLISFYLSFNNWINTSQPIPNILKQLHNRDNTLSRASNWIEEKKLVVTDTNPDCARIYFLVSVDIFYDVLSNPDIGYELLDEQIVTLAQNKDKTTVDESHSFTL